MLRKDRESIVVVLNHLLFGRMAIDASVDKLGERFEAKLEQIDLDRNTVTFSLLPAPSKTIKRKTNLGFAVGTLTPPVHFWSSCIEHNGNTVVGTLPELLEDNERRARPRYRFSARDNHEAVCLFGLMGGIGVLGRVIDISEQGMAITASKAVDVQTQKTVYVDSEVLRRAGVNAMVRLTMAPLPEQEFSGKLVYCASDKRGKVVVVSFPRTTPSIDMKIRQFVERRRTIGAVPFETTPTRGVIELRRPEPARREEPLASSAAVKVEAAPVAKPVAAVPEAAKPTPASIATGQPSPQAAREAQPAKEAQITGRNGAGIAPAPAGGAERKIAAPSSDGAERPLLAGGWDEEVMAGVLGRESSGAAGAVNAPAPSDELTEPRPTGLRFTRNGMERLEVPEEAVPKIRKPILIVDREEEALDLRNRLLAKGCEKVWVAGSFEEAKDTLWGTPISVVISELLGTPEASASFLQSIQRKRVVVQTSELTRETLTVLYKSGLMEILVKPLSDTRLDDFLETLKSSE